MPLFMNGKKSSSLKRVSKSIKGHFIKDLRLFVEHCSHVDTYGVTDESFAVNLAEFRVGGWHRYQALAVGQKVQSYK
jgi:hypothetical protein